MHVTAKSISSVLVLMAFSCEATPSGSATGEPSVGGIQTSSGSSVDDNNDEKDVSQANPLRCSDDDAHSCPADIQTLQWWLRHAVDRHYVAKIATVSIQERSVVEQVPFAGGVVNETGVLWDMTFSEVSSEGSGATATATILAPGCVQVEFSDDVDPAVRPTYRPLCGEAPGGYWPKSGEMLLIISREPYREFVRVFPVVGGAVPAEYSNTGQAEIVEAALSAAGLAPSQVTAGSEADAN